jgi:hypothetical protein
VVKPEGKRPLGKCGRRWDNIEVVLKTAGWDGPGHDCCGCCERGDEHWGCVKCGKLLGQSRNCKLLEKEYTELVDK